MSTIGWIVLAVGIAGAVLIAVLLANRNTAADAIGGPESAEGGRSVLQRVFDLAGADKEVSGTVGDVGDIIGGLTARV